GRRKVKNYPKQSSPRPIRLSTPAHDSSESVPAEFLQALAEPLGQADFEDDSIPPPSEDTSSGTGTSPPSLGTAPQGRTTSRAERPSGLTGVAGVVGARPPRREPAPDEHDDDEPTNPGGRPPTQPPGALFDPDDEDEFRFRPSADMPPALDDLSDLLVAKSSRPPPSLPTVSVPTERPGTASAEQEPLLLATVPPPRREPRPSHPTDLLASPHFAPPQFRPGPGLRMRPSLSA